MPQGGAPRVTTGARPWFFTVRFSRSTPIKEILNCRLATCRRDNRTKPLHGRRCLRWAFAYCPNSRDILYPNQKYWDGWGWTATNAHNLIFRVFRLDGAPLPDGHVIDHMCENPWCVELEHLQCVSRSENATARKTNLRPRKPMKKKLLEEARRTRDRRRGNRTRKYKPSRRSIPMQGA